MSGREGERALLPDGEHRRVYVAYGYVDVWVRVDVVRVVQHAEGYVACAAGDVEDALRGGWGARGVAWVEGGDEMVSVWLWVCG